MDYSDQTRRQAERAIERIAMKFPADKSENYPITDIHLRVNPDSGELLAFDDDEREINRCVIDEWIGSTDEYFYNNVADYLRELVRQMSPTVDGMGILKPFSIVVEDEECEPVCEIYVFDDDTKIIGGDIMSDLEGDLDSFLDNLKLE